MVGNAAPAVKAHRRAEEWLVVESLLNGHVFVFGLEPQHADPVRDDDLLIHCGFAWAWGVLIAAIRCPGAYIDTQPTCPSPSVIPARCLTIYGGFTHRDMISPIRHGHHPGVPQLLRQFSFNRDGAWDIRNQFCVYRCRWDRNQETHQ